VAALIARPVAWIRRLVAPFLERLVEVELFDRAVALASQAFVALIPLMVVAAALLPYGQRAGFADSIVQRFHLSGDSADAIERVFAQPAEIQSTLSAFGVLLLVVSALSFCRALARLYEKAWRLAPRGMRSTPTHLIWLAVACVYTSIAEFLNTTAADWLGPVGRLAVAFVLSFLIWLWTPYVMLRRRVERRDLRWTGGLTATGMVAYSVGSLYNMPHAIEESAERFGTIGIAIAIVSWLIGVGFILVVGAAFGAVLAGRRALQRQAH
jgi:membrane protein